MKRLEGGLRLKGRSKKNPLITIVTVVRNGEKTLERAIKSVINQTARKKIEYIIIDGASTDKTLDIIKKYNNEIDYWMSEPDKGIYDAMNKGVLLARGEYIYFLGCDDYLCNNEVIFGIKREIKTEPTHLIYGNVLVNNRPYPNRIITLKALKNGRNIAHQGLFAKKEIIINEGLFNYNYKIVGDFELILRLFIKGYSSRFIKQNIAHYSKDGGASSNPHDCLKESSKIILYYFGYFAFIKFYLLVKINIIAYRILKFLRKAKLIR